jgi:hypothetical protein
LGLAKLFNPVVFNGLFGESVGIFTEDVFDREVFSLGNTETPIQEPVLVEPSLTGEVFRKVWFEDDFELLGLISLYLISKIEARRN